MTKLLLINTFSDTAIKIFSIIMTRLKINKTSYSQQMNGEFKKRFLKQNYSGK